MPRSLTADYTLLPAHQQTNDSALYALKRSESLLSYTFGRGTVIWRIYPAVLVHTVFAAIIVTLYEKTMIKIAVPGVLLTVLGVVIGFVISYRASSGYDRYWMGRSCWADVIHHGRALSRLIWFHVQPRLRGIPVGQGLDAAPPSEEEFQIVIAEKRMALDLIEGFLVALKHHLRDENGIYYEDLYHLVRPLHEHHHHHHEDIPENPLEYVASPIDASELHRPPIRPVHNYGATNGHASDHNANHHSHAEAAPLLRPSVTTTSETHVTQVADSLVPFGSFVGRVKRVFGFKPPAKIVPDPEQGHTNPDGPTGPTAPRSPSSEDGAKKPVILQRSLTYKPKRRLRIAGGGENIPLDICRLLSEWICVLEMRNSMSGNAAAGAYGLISALEDSLSQLEKILTTPLPFTYSAHIRHTVWIYLFFLPLQLVEQFHWFAIFGVAAASFIYLGFLAAGEEIEQPFGYDENDLDLDLFCKQLIHADINELKGTHTIYAPVGKPSDHYKRRSLVEVSAYNKGKGPAPEVNAALAASFIIKPLSKKESQKKLRAEVQAQVVPPQNLNGNGHGTAK